jgi:hypothetical protein
METKKQTKTTSPINQKSLYFSFAELYAKIMNDEIELEKAEQAVKALSGMNSVYGNEIKRAKVENTTIRIVELKAEEIEHTKIEGKTND